ncbi:MAG: Ig-like domain-containing protein [Flavobacteriales bacterium]|nr:Ig-like domain-containing protein [Flavobacteriales bacterium]
MNLKTAFSHKRTSWHRLIYLPIAILFLLSFVDCAKKGRPSGGKRDSIPPVIVRSNPENYTTNFNSNEIRIYFDEYIKLNELQKNLIISPPLQYQPIITPINTSKVLKIEILDTLKENTTYSFNFGKSIVDNNEGNEFEYFKYVFSTGDYIDSLQLSGRVRDAERLQPEQPITVMLYEVHEQFTDSIIYREKPTYITVTKDSTNTFELTNLKAGDYLLLALKDKNNDFIFQPTSDKIGFVAEYISLPSDSTYTMSLFKETLGYEMARPSHTSKNEILFGYSGNIDSLQLDLLTQVPNDFTSTTYRDIKTDTLHYWFKPSVEKDTLLFTATNYNNIDTLAVRMQDLYRDSLKIKALNSGTVLPMDTLRLSANTPLETFDSEKIIVTDKDTSLVAAGIQIDPTHNLITVSFPKQEEQNYKVELLPGAVTDFFGMTNDSLSYQLRTKPTSDYGTLSLTLQNVNNLPMIVQLVDKNYEVVKERYLKENRQVLFDYIAPGTYFLRIVYDENANQIWDSGNFLERRQPEKIVYYPTSLEVRANWSLNETFILE